MKVFYTASFYSKKRLQKYYDLILKSIKDTGVEVISTETGNYTKLLNEKDKKKLWNIRAMHYEAVKRGILKSDVVIIEITNQDFQLGHEATIAIQAKKPVLCLSQKEDMSQKIINRYFQGAKYDKDNVKEIVEQFINKSSKSMLSERFNLFLSSSQMEYLKKISEKSGVNKSEYIRKLIDNDIK